MGLPPILSQWHSRTMLTCLYDVYAAYYATFSSITASSTGIEKVITAF